MLAALNITADTLAETVAICVAAVVIVWLVLRSRKRTDVKVTIHFPRDDEEDDD